MAVRDDLYKCAENAALTWLEGHLSLEHGVNVRLHSEERERLLTRHDEAHRVGTYHPKRPAHAHK